MTTILLGPQRFRTTAGSVLRSVAPDGQIATVTAGWQDRESDTAELDQVLEGRGRHLNLYGRLLDLLATDRRFADAAAVHQEAVDELVSIYSLRLQRALETTYAVQRRNVRRTDLLASAVTDAVDVVRSIDGWYLDALDRIHDELRRGAAVETSEPLQRHRVEVAGLLGEASAMVIAGGHVGLLLRCLQLFDIDPPAELPVVAWSAGAMALTDRVVLYNDRGPSGVVGSELWDRGLGRAPRVVALPHARRRLRMDDPSVLRVLVRRFADARCVLLDDGARVDIGTAGELPAGARVIGEDGRVHELGLDRPADGLLRETG